MVDTRLWITAALLLVLWCGLGSTMCPLNSFDSVTILETDANGTSLLNITAISDVSWSIVLNTNPPLRNLELMQFLQGSVTSTDDNGTFRVFLAYALDLELIYQRYNYVLTTVQFRLLCNSSQPSEYEFLIIVTPVNEYDPVFVGAPYVVTVPENLSIGTTVMRLRDNATDHDVTNTGNSDVSQFSWTFHAWPGINISGSNYFAMDNRQNGVITVKKLLDFEALPIPSSFNQPFFVFNITVIDFGGRNTTNSTVFYIQDMDDQPPEFIYPGCSRPCLGFYTATVSSTHTGVLLGISPANIFARDQDTLNIPVGYSVPSGPSSFRNYLAINSTTGEVTILQPLGNYNKEQLIFKIRATKVSSSALREDATLMLTVTFPDGHTPTDTPTAQASTSSTNSVVVAVVVLAIVVFLAFVGLAGLVVYIKNRSNKFIHPETDLAELEDEEEDDVDDDGGNTDSGHGSMNGTMVPNSPHSSSTAPTYTRMIMPNGKVMPVPLKGKLRRMQPLQRAPGDNPAAGIEESAEEGSEGGRRMSMQDRISMQDIDAKGGMARALAPSPHMANGNVPREGIPAVSGGVPMPFAHMPNGGVANSQMPTPIQLPNGQIVYAAVDAHGNPVFPGLLQPFSAEDSGGLERRMSKKKRKKLEAAMVAKQEYDGTKEFREKPDPSFYTQGGKQKVKLSSRKKNTDPIEPKHRLEVEEDDVEQD